MTKKLKAIDLFAGAGGFTTGAEQAGLQVVWAANHWPAAVRCHSQNHSRTSHACQDLHQANCLVAQVREINVDVGVTPDHLGSVYRTAIFRCHPDHGGDAELFRRVQEAKQILDKWLAV